MNCIYRSCENITYSISYIRYKIFYHTGFEICYTGIFFAHTGTVRGSYVCVRETLSSFMSGEKSFIPFFGVTVLDVILLFLYCNIFAYVYGVTILCFSMHHFHSLWFQKTTYVVKRSHQNRMVLIHSLSFGRRGTCGHGYRTGPLRFKKFRPLPVKLENFEILKKICPWKAKNTQKFVRERLIWLYERVPRRRAQKTVDFWCSKSKNDNLEHKIPHFWTV